jgi:hypothetical protein
MLWELQLKLKDQRKQRKVENRVNADRARLLGAVGIEQRKIAIAYFKNLIKGVTK